MVSPGVLIPCHPAERMGRALWVEMAILATVSSLFTDGERNGAKLMCAWFSSNSGTKLQPEHAKKRSRSHGRHISYRLDVCFSQTISTI